MAFDPTPFVENLGILQNLWLDASLRQRSEHLRYNGYIDNKPNFDGHIPSWHTGGVWIIQSNHERLYHKRWTARMIEAFQNMDACMRQIPVLNNSLLSWHISFLIRNGCAEYSLIIQDARQSCNFVKTSAHAGKRLKQIAEQTENCKVPKPEKVFLIDATKYVAATPDDAVKIRTALNPKAPHPADILVIEEITPEQ